MVDLLGLEPCWKSVQPGQFLDFFAETIFLDETNQKHLLRSCLHKQFVVIEGALEKAAAFSILGAEVLKVDKGIRISVDKATILAHQVSQLGDLTNVIELCAGAGYLGEGLVSAGYRIKVANELRPKNCALYEKWHDADSTKVICGDIADRSVLKQIHDAHEHPAMITFGFNCQPWSLLGDKGQLNDERSQCLVHCLRAAYWLRAHTVVMECVPMAGKDPNVKKVIQSFSAATGLWGSEVVLQLGDIMPSKRERWWCVLHSPAGPPFKLQELPKLPTIPTLGT